MTTTQVKTMTEQPGYHVPYLTMLNVIGTPTGYKFWQEQTTTSGQFYVGGVAQAKHTSIIMTPAQAATAYFLMSDTDETGIEVQVQDATGWNPWVTFNICATSTYIPAGGVGPAGTGGLGAISANLNQQCDMTDTFLDWTKTHWVNDLGTIQIVKIFGDIGTDFHQTPGNAEPIGQYNSGVQIWPGGDQTKALTIFAHSPEVFTTGAGSGWWKHEANYPDPGIIVQNGDVLYFVANAFNPYLASPGFNWQENFQVFFKKN